MPSDTTAETTHTIPLFGNRSRPLGGSGGSYGAGVTIAAAVSTGRLGDRLIKTRRIPVLTNLQQEWKTPPLWGVQDSAPYLHDGRAQTLVEAIAWHGGEAKTTAERYFTLTAANQLAVIEFLRTLRAPNVIPD